MKPTATFGSKSAADDHGRIGSSAAVGRAAGSADRWRWRLRRVADALGLPGVVALLLALFCVHTALTGVLPAVEALQAERSRATTLQAVPARASGVVAAASAPGPVDFDTFLLRFQPERSASAALGQLHRIARRHGIVLPQGEFRLLPQEGLPLTRYTMVLPVSAPYATLRAFLSQLLREMPGLALQDLNLQRSETGVPGEVVARLGFALYLRSED